MAPQSYSGALLPGLGLVALCHSARHVGHRTWSRHHYKIYRAPLQPKGRSKKRGAWCAFAKGPHIGKNRRRSAGPGHDS
eukprot:8702223-Pyramimonas_sp.AAC.1